MAQNETVGDEVGTDHTAFAFSPFLWQADSAETAYQAHVSSGPGSGQLYDWAQLMLPDPPGPTEPSSCTIAHFYFLIRWREDILGTLFIATHGGNNKLAMEPYEKTRAGKAARDAAYQKYLKKS